ncbi:NAD(P)/FAD-dependent oxidoreductase [Clostridium felsineum]|uniref:NAD(P)/FAD-dependent oxidoreductase n=1 Tax=Clostridium felsineum TaxID=36839 RepID=UPI00098BF8CB|nr:NAD(P)/FAD-dependent oxidoreductase [Clostridium felsineum]URZ14321.1 3-dehydro-bile acid delta(4,6)-reductase [Clostridium felsineum DSM 794]
MKVIIIGGGASGITAAISAKDLGYDVLILERNDRIGKKILTTGNGRCNITNKNITTSRYHSSNPNFFEHTLNEFTKENTLEFFETLGLPIISLDDGKMYPLSLQASSVLDILRLALDERGIEIITSSKVTEIIKNKNSFKIVSNGTDYFCDKIILATGGKSAPKSGSDGLGLALASSLGHSIIKTAPALVQLKLDFKNLRALSGIKFDGNIKILVDDIEKRQEFGEILFTDYGVSGPPILQLSRIASYGIEEKRTVTIKIDMLPNYSEDDLKAFLENHWGMFSYRSVYDSFIGVINKKMIPILLKQCGIVDIHKCCFDLTWEEKQNIFKYLKHWIFKVSGTNSYTNSQVTAGGINTLEVNNTTLESKITPNLYFCGEILDVDGDCGGFNLQWAWSSGYIAGKCL